MPNFITITLTLLISFLKRNYSPKKNKTLVPVRTTNKHFKYQIEESEKALLFNEN